MTLYVVCALEIIRFPNKRVESFFITFSYKYHILLKFVKKPLTPELQSLLSRVFYKYRQLLNCILVKLGWVS